MYRKMQATQQEIIPMANKDVAGKGLECVEMVCKLPVVEAVAVGAADARERVRAMGGVAEWTLAAAEGAAATMGRAAAQAATHLPAAPVAAVDRTLCSGLALLEQKVPLVTQQPAEIMKEARDKVSAVGNYGWNKANDVLSTRWGVVALSGFDTTASLFSKYLDVCLPPQQGEVNLPVETLGDEDDKVGHTLQTVGRLSGKVRSRVYRAVVLQMQGLKTQSEHSVAQVSQLLSMIPNKEEAEEDARRLAQSVSTFLSSVPDKVGHLMPASLAEQVAQAQQYAHQLYETLLNSTVKNVSDTVMEQTNKVQTALQDIGTFAHQLMETFKAKNREITEVGSQMAIEG